MSKPIEEAIELNEKKEDDFADEFAVIGMTGYFEVPIRKED